MSFLARTPVIWTSFVLMLVIGVGFSLFRPMVGGALLDMTSDPEAARTIIATMSDAQRTALPATQSEVLKSAHRNVISRGLAPRTARQILEFFLS